MVEQIPIVLIKTRMQCDIIIIYFHVAYNFFVTKIPTNDLISIEFVLHETTLIIMVSLVGDIMRMLTICRLKTVVLLNCSVDSLCTLVEC